MRRNEILLERKTLAHLVEGAAFLGSGGGGMISAGERFIEKTLRGKKVSIITPPFTKAQKDMIACVVCDLGSITRFEDDQDKALGLAFKQLFEYFDELKPTALIPIETGAENSMAPIVLASMLGLAVIDCDGAGRAVPTLPLTCFSAIGKLENPGPVAIASGKGDVLLVGGKDARAYESLLRPIANLENFGSSASLAMWPGHVRNFAKNGVTRSMSRAIALGNLLAALRSGDSRSIKTQLKIVNALKGVLLAAGRVSKVTMAEANASNTATVEIENQLEGDLITVLSKNENLIAYSDKKDGPVAIAPESICYLKAEMTPLTNSEIAKGDMVYLVAVEANAKLNRREMKKGFDEIIRGLGYAGSLKSRNHRFVKLGNLIKGLRRIKID